MSQELKCHLALNYSRIWLLVCIGLHSVALFATLMLLNHPVLQVIYSSVIVLLCSYACYRHVCTLPRFTYFTNGYIQFEGSAELWSIMPQSSCSDLFIILICKNEHQPQLKKQLYIMRDAVVDADYRRLTRTIKILNH